MKNSVARYLTLTQMKCSCVATNQAESCQIFSTFVSCGQTKFAAIL